MKSFYKYSVSILSIAFLFACGGGGGGGGNVVVNVDPQGLWKGTNSSSQATVNIAVLDNGEAWGIFSEGASLLGAIYGNATTNGNNISASGKAINFETLSSSSVNLTGTVAAKSTMTLATLGVSIPLVYQPSYETAATANAISGTWSFDARLVRSGNVNTPPTETITIDDAGAFSVGNSFCQISGSVTPQSGGKNIYSLTMSVTGLLDVCDVPSSMSGIVYIDTSVTPNKFFSLALSPNKDNAVFAIGQKEVVN